MDEIVIQILIPIAVTIIAGIFLPKRSINLIRDFIGFMFSSAKKLWFVTISLLVIYFFINFKNVHLQILESILFIFLILAVVTIVNFFLFLKIRFKRPNIAIYGTFSSKNGEYLTTDIDSKLLDQKVRDEIEIISNNHFIFRESLLNIHWINIPDFYVNFLGLGKLNSFISKKSFKNHIASVHFIRNINEQNIVAKIITNKNDLTNSEHIEEELYIIEEISNNTNINNNKKLEIIIQIYCIVFSQSFNDLLLYEKNYQELHRTLDDNFKLISRLNENLEEIGFTKKGREFISFWNGSNFRYKSLLLMEQKEFIGSIDYAVKSILNNPYYPFKNYKKLKHEYTKIYGISLAPSINKAKEDLNLEIDEEKVKRSILMLRDQVKYPTMPFLYNIFLEILHKKHDGEIISKLEDSFKLLDRNNPFILLIQSEVLKYMKKGEEKHDQIYIARLGECIDLLEQILRIDKDFTLINTKVGIMKSLKGLYEDNDELLKEGMEEWVKGAHFIKELGIE